MKWGVCKFSDCVSEENESPYPAKKYWKLRPLLFWSEKRGSNPRPRPWQGRALPLSYSRSWYERGDLNSHIVKIPDPKSGASANSATLAFAFARVRMARLVGFEPTTFGFEVHCSIQLSYKRKFLIFMFWGE